MASRNKCSCLESSDKSKVIPVVHEDTDRSPQEGDDSNVTLCVGLLLLFFASHISGPHFVAEVVFCDDEEKEDGGVFIFLCIATGDCGGVSNDGAYLITPGLCKHSSLLFL